MLAKFCKPRRVTCPCTVYFYFFVQAKKLSLAHFWEVETGKIYPQLTIPHSQLAGRHWMQIVTTWNKKASVVKTRTLWSQTVRWLNKRRQKSHAYVIFAFFCSFCFLLFAIRRRLRSHFKNSCFVFHRGFQTLENNKSTRPTASCFHQFSRVWKPRWNTRTRFWNITWTTGAWRPERPPSRTL